jgi:hypothetical protein
VVRDVLALVNLASKLVSEVSELVLDVEQSPAMRAHGYFGAQLADAGVGALAHVAAAQASYTLDYMSRLQALSSLSGGRGALSEVKRLTKAAHAGGLVSDAICESITATADQAIAVLLALTVELRGVNRGIDAA